MNSIIILSGIPGSGKTHYYETVLAPKGYVKCSADDFMGEHFDAKRLNECHAKCFAKYLSYANRKLVRASICVDNTNLHAWEISPYMLAVQGSEHTSARIVRILCDPSEAYKRQQHNVPMMAHEKMQIQFKKKDILPWWKYEEIRID